MVLFPDVTQLDLTGPYEVLGRLPGAELSLVWKTLEPVRSDSGLRLLPTVTFADAPDFDVVFVPGGRGNIPLMEDAEVLAFLRRKAASARYVTAVCTGALVLGAAGLLEGYAATTHWVFHDLLELCGARPVKQRVVIDRDRVTGGGVTAGIDFAFQLAAELCGEATARSIQLAIEYDPAPPFASGSEGSAEPELVAAVRRQHEPSYAARRAALTRARAS
jgi:cyclohexyl-isocyanide hydratase